LLRKAPGRSLESRLAERRESIESTAGVHRPVKVTPLAFDPDIRLVHAPTVVGRFRSGAPTSFQFRGVALDSPPDGDVVDQKSALGQQLLNITIGK